MILLLGGVAETAAIALGLAQAGYEVLVSTATALPLCIGTHPRVSLRQGRLSEAEMTALLRARSVRAVVDAAHPYAAQAHRSAQNAAAAAGIFYAAWVRPGLASDLLREDMRWAATHEAAAAIAFSCGLPVLLTIGVRNLEPYVRQSRATGVAMIARVLPYEDSRAACRQAGIPDSRVIAGRGPFSVATNVRHIREHGIGVLVSKDSGAAGGVAEKLEAARLAACRVVMVARPQRQAAATFADIPALLDALLGAVAPASSALKR